MKYNKITDNAESEGAINMEHLQKNNAAYHINNFLQVSHFLILYVNNIKHTRKYIIRPLRRPASFEGTLERHNRRVNDTHTSSKFNAFLLNLHLIDAPY